VFPVGRWEALRREETMWRVWLWKYLDFFVFRGKRAYLGSVEGDETFWQSRSGLYKNEKRGFIT
jgi:hypothetical protein